MKRTKKESIFLNITVDSTDSERVYEAFETLKEYLYRVLRHSQKKCLLYTDVGTYSFYSLKKDTAFLRLEDKPIIHIVLHGKGLWDIEEEILNRLDVVRVFSRWTRLSNRKRISERNLKTIMKMSRRRCLIKARYSPKRNETTLSEINEFLKGGCYDY